jgi:hypothetical protein
VKKVLHLLHLLLLRKSVWSSLVIFVSLKRSLRVDEGPRVNEWKMLALHEGSDRPATWKEHFVDLAAWVCMYASMPH